MTAMIALCTLLVLQFAYIAIMAFSVDRMARRLEETETALHKMTGRLQAAQTALSARRIPRDEGSWL